MRILVIQNDPHTPIGMVGERVAARSIAADTVLPHDGGTLPGSTGGYDAAIVLGGPMAADDDSGYPALLPMLDLVQRFHDEDKPLLGICLGAQVLARCFGGRVRRYEGGLELGYVPLRLTDQGEADPLLGGNGRSQRIMQWHEDTFNLPPAAVQLMDGVDCPAQAFRYGRAAYAFQCHFEADPDIVENWLGCFGKNLPRHFGDGAPAQMARVRQEAAAHGAAQRRFAEAVSDRWLDLLQPR